MQLYIDSNIWLEYFRENSKERLLPLRELEKLVTSKKVTLLLPSQTIEEYERNKKSVAAKTRKILIEQSKKALIIPSLFDPKRDDVKKFIKKSKELEKLSKAFVEKYDEEVKKEKTDADKLIRKIYSKAKKLQENKTIIERAHKRYLKGNPPRKSDHSYGDAIIWETLLSKASSKKLFIVSRDSDFIESYADETELHSYLAKEWKKEKKNSAELYTSLAEFIKKTNKKSKIKKTTVSEEKSRPLYTSITGVDVSSLIPEASIEMGMTLLGENQTVHVSDLYDNPFDLTASRFQTASKRYCPYCGKKNNVTSLSINQQCESCHKRYSVY